MPSVSPPWRFRASKARSQRSRIGAWTCAQGGGASALCCGAMAVCAARKLCRESSSVSAAPSSASSCASFVIKVNSSAAFIIQVNDSATFLINANSRTHRRCPQHQQRLSQHRQTIASGSTAHQTTIASQPAVGGHQGPQSRLPPRLRLRPPQLAPPHRRRHLCSEPLERLWSPRRAVKDRSDRPDAKPSTGARSAALARVAGGTSPRSRERRTGTPRATGLRRRRRTELLHTATRFRSAPVEQRQRGECRQRKLRAKGVTRLCNP
jgi:hypothetical protein